MDKGTVTIGVDYYTDLVREHAMMEQQRRQMKRFLTEESTSKMVYISEVARILGLVLKEGGEDE